MYFLDQILFSLQTDQPTHYYFLFCTVWCTNHWYTVNSIQFLSKHGLSSVHRLSGLICSLTARQIVRGRGTSDTGTHFCDYWVWYSTRSWHHDWSVSLHAASFQSRSYSCMIDSTMSGSVDQNHCSFLSKWKCGKWPDWSVCCKATMIRSQSFHCMVDLMISGSVDQNHG